MSNRAELLIDALLDATYLIREVTPRSGEKASYEIAKFTTGKQPNTVYRVVLGNRGWTCDCPGFRRVTQRDAPKHKHVMLVNAWVKRGKPNPLTTPGFQEWVAKILV